MSSVSGDIAQDILWSTLWHIHFIHFIYFSKNMYTHTHVSQTTFSIHFLPDETTIFPFIYCTRANFFMGVKYILVSKSI